MFIEKYNQFLKQISKINHKEQKEYFESSSIEGQPLFGLNDYSKPEYYSVKNYLKIDFIKQVVTELKNVNSKFLFVNGFCKEYETYLKNIVKKLDQEYIDIQNNVSFKGISFINMTENYSDFNNVVDEEIIYKKNIAISDEMIYKEDNISTTIPFRITNYNENTVILNFDELSKITETIIDFNYEIIYSLYGTGEDGTSKLLFKDMNSVNNKVLVYAGVEKYSQLTIVSNNKITKLVKNIVVYATNSELVNEFYNSFILRKYVVTDFSEFILASDSETTLHKINESDVYDFINLVNTVEEQAISKYCSLGNLVNKNEISKPSIDVGNFYLVEYINKNIYNSDRLKVYGKERENEH